MTNKGKCRKYNRLYRGRSVADGDDRQRFIVGKLQLRVTREVKLVGIEYEDDIVFSQEVSHYRKLQISNALYPNPGDLVRGLGGTKVPKFCGDWSKICV